MLDKIVPILLWASGKCIMDSINSLFEFGGGFFVLLNCIKLHADKQVKGVSFVATAFFMVWGWWNIIYYPALDQWVSAIGAGSVAVVNTVWLGQMIYYMRKGQR